MTISFLYSPIRSNDYRIDYFFDPENSEITVTHKSGKEILTKKKNTPSYHFEIKKSTKTTYNLEQLISRNPEPPTIENFPFLEVEKNNDSYRVKILKPYGSETENDSRLTFPDWVTVTKQTDEKNAELKTSLTYQEEILRSCHDQISEITSQNNNLIIMLTEHLAQQPTEIVSPITVRALKTSILLNTIIFCEASANLLYIIEIIHANPDCPTEKFVETLNKAAPNSPLKERIKKSIDSVSKRTNLEPPNFSKDKKWLLFTKTIEKRDNLVHIKINKNQPSKNLTLNQINKSIEVSNQDILNCIILKDFFYTQIKQLTKSIPSVSSSFTNQLTNISFEYLITLQAAAALNQKSLEEISKRNSIDLRQYNPLAYF